MKQRFLRLWARSYLFRALVVYGGLALLAWLDGDGCLAAQRAGVFGFIIPALEAIWAAYTTVQDAIVTALEWVVQWLVGMVTWIAKALVSFIQGAGVVFAKIWDALETVWQRVLKPFLSWLDEQILKLRDWLKRVFGPILDWVNTVRRFITDLYDRFVRPFLDLLDFIHQLRNLLDLLHIHILDGIDNFLQSLERKIDAVFSWIYSQLARFGYWVDFIITADGFFQRYTLLRSEARYIVDRWRLLINSRGHLPPHPFANDKHVGKTPATPQEISDATGQYLEFGGGPAAAVIDEVSIEFLKFLRT